MIGKRNPHTLRLTGIGEETQKAASRLADGVITRHVTIRPLRPKAGDRTINNLKIDLLDIVITQAAFVHDSGTKVLYHYVGIAHQFEGDVTPFVGPQIQRYAFLVA